MRVEEAVRQLREAAAVAEVTVHVLEGEIRIRRGRAGELIVVNPGFSPAARYWQSVIDSAAAIA